jgi:hypothetical protein
LGDEPFLIFRLEVMESHAGFLIGHIQRALMGKARITAITADVVEQPVRNYDPNRRLQVLQLLQIAGKPLKKHEIIAQTGFPKGTVGYIFTWLKEKKWIKRVGENRGHNVAWTITPLGQNIDINKLLKGPETQEAQPISKVKRLPAPARRSA